jgi:hypothetical protein
MTSATLISQNRTLLTKVSTVTLELVARDSVPCESPTREPAPLGRVVTLAASPAALAIQSAKLPYQADQCLELLNLQAETEALLQQLQSLKEQRLAMES